MTELNKLRNKLKEVPEIKESLEELKFGCKIKWINGKEDILLGGYGKYGYPTSKGALEPSINKGDYIIIGNPIQFSHLLRYCRNIKVGKTIEINELGQITSKGILITTLTHSKDFQDQSEETFKSINEFISNLK